MLPARRADLLPPGLERPAPTPVRPAGAALRILLVEDSPGDARLVVEMLGDDDGGGLKPLVHELTCVPSLSLALAAVAAGSHDVVLVDLSLPDSAGLDTFLRIARAAPGAALIVLSGLQDEEVAVAALKQGAQDYLVKGRVDAEQLHRAIRYALERKRVEEALQENEESLLQAQKLEAIGLLAGGVAHDFNNLLTAILSCGELLLERSDLAPEARQQVLEIKEAGERAAALTGQLLAFGRKQLLFPQVIDLNAVVSQMRGLLRRVIPENIEIATRLDPALGRTRADPRQLEQVVVNLAVNARDAMAAGGTLTIETRNVDAGDGAGDDPEQLPPGRYVLLAVIDSGSGMDARTRARLFEPFFTTKERGHGTGLGLATVYGIVKQSSGAIRVHSETGRGTEMRVYLPRLDGAPAPARDGAAAPGREARGTETVLLVEDQAQVRQVTAAALRGAGYAVLEAFDGEDALRVARGAGELDLLVTDVVMPRVGGRELARRLRAERPRLKVVFLSGYAEHGLDRLDESSTFVQKPFTPSGLTAKIREVLGRGGAPGSPVLAAADGEPRP